MYPTSLSDAQWQVINNIQQQEQRKRKHSLRIIWDSIFYLIKTGCQWRMLPTDFPKWQLVYYYFRKWQADGSLEEVHDRIHEKIRQDMGKASSPSLGLMDSQSVKTSSMTVEKGYDGNKNLTGRKRHVLADTLGFVMAVIVHKANISDREGAKLLLQRAQYKYPRLQKIMVDQGYTGELLGWVLNTFGWIVEVVSRVAGIGFQVLPKRWIVERTFGWFNFQRRLAKDYELLTECSEAMIHLTMIRIMLHKIPIEKFKQPLRSCLKTI